MKRWAALVVMLYGLMLGLLTVPMILAFGLEFDTGRGWSNSIGLEELLEVVRHWGYWLGLAVMLAGQAVLLLVPVAAAEGRPVSRRKLLAPILATSFFLANLAFAGLAALACAVFPKDRAPEILLAPAETSRRVLEMLPPLGNALNTIGLGPSSGFLELGLCLGYIALLWMIWGLVFFRFSRDTTGISPVRRAMSWLLRGSILELLVAVPSHVVVRQRGDCCAPFATFWGITLGLSVMLLAFGPGVFFLFVDRMRRLQPAKQDRN